MRGYNLIWQMWCACGQTILRCKCRIGWIKSNEELNRLTGNKNIINYIKAQRLAWFGHVHCMPDNSILKIVYQWSPALTRSLGRPKNKWEDDVKNDITRMKITNWKNCIRNRTKWKKLVEKAKTSLKLQHLKKKKKCRIVNWKYVRVGVGRL